MLEAPPDQHRASVGEPGGASPRPDGQHEPIEQLAHGEPGERADLSAPIEVPIILYDGQCGLCHRSVRWLLRRDGGRLRYAPLQGPTAAELRRRFPAIPMTLESVVLVDGGHAWLRSRAFLHAARYLERPWRWGYALRWLPAALLDPLYRVIAHYRYRWFGHYDECRLPSEAERRRFLP
jgi:predicted DCC family thiol-disulfide oxidoreductase YuxK